MGFDTVQPIKWNKFSKFDIKSHSKTHQKQLYFHLFYLSDKTCYKQASSSTEFQTVKIGYLDHFKKLNIADGITFTHWMVRVEEVASRAPRRQTVQLYLQHDQYWNRKQIVWFLCVCVCKCVCDYGFNICLIIECLLDLAKGEGKYCTAYSLWWRWRVSSTNAHYMKRSTMTLQIIL